MYLLNLNDDGLVHDVNDGDSWKVISEFRNVYKKHGLKGMTVVAVTADYDSVYGYYNENDRFARTVKEIYGDSDAIKKDQLMVKAIIKYNELQFNANLEHDRINQEYKINILNKIRAASYDTSAESTAEFERLNEVLRKFEESTKKFYSNFNKHEEIGKNSITSSGYEISRIEQDLFTNKNSKFANEGKSFKNPNKLGL